MNQTERCQYLIDKGFKYDPETGNVISGRNNILKSIGSSGYLKINVFKNNKRYELRQHQFAWYFMKNEIPENIDHINRIRTDNRWINLRSVTKAQNQLNLTATGVTYIAQNNCYLARIQLNKKQYSLGRYKTAQEANEAYLKAKEHYHKIE